jgi:hypothetical protein
MALSQQANRYNRSWVSKVLNDNFVVEFPVPLSNPRGRPIRKEIQLRSTETSPLQSRIDTTPAGQFVFPYLEDKSTLVEHAEGGDIDDQLYRLSRVLSFRLGATLVRRETFKGSHITTEVTSSPRLEVVGFINAGV